jgi:hypothetical protein
MSRAGAERTGACAALRFPECLFRKRRDEGVCWNSASKKEGIDRAPDFPASPTQERRLGSRRHAEELRHEQDSKQGLEDIDRFFSCPNPRTFRKSRGVVAGSKPQAHIIVCGPRFVNPDLGSSANWVGRNCANRAVPLVAERNSTEYELWELCGRRSRSMRFDCAYSAWARRRRRGRLVSWELSQSVSRHANFADDGLQG